MDKITAYSEEREEDMLRELLDQEIRFYDQSVALSELTKKVEKLEREVKYYTQKEKGG